MVIVVKLNSNYYQLLYIKELKATKDTIIVIQKEQKKIGFISMMKHTNLLIFQNASIRMPICSYMRESNEVKKCEILIIYNFPYIKILFHL